MDSETADGPGRGLRGHEMMVLEGRICGTQHLVRSYERVPNYAAFESVAIELFASF